MAPIKRAFHFDDGSPSVEEVTAPVDDARVVSAVGGNVYATWYIRPDGVYRRDPLGPALLRYLPAELKADLTWYQQSGDTRVWFWLQKSDQCGEAPTGVKGAAACWDLQIINRDQRQTLRFATGQGVVWASSLSLTKPTASYHKEPVGAPTSGGSIPKQAAEPWDASSVAPVTTLSPSDFMGAQQAWLKATPLIDGNGQPIGLAAVGPMGTWTTTGLVVVDARDPGLHWERLLVGTVERKFQVVDDRVTWVLVQDKTQEGSQVTVSGAIITPTSPWQTGLIFGWEPKVFDIAVNRVQVDGTGHVAVERDLNDPAHHTERIQYETKWRDARDVYLSQLRRELRPTTGTLTYPTSPRDVLMAALVARSYDLKDELSGYFAHPVAAQAFRDYALTPSKYGFRGLHADVGRLIPVPPPQNGVSPDVVPDVKIEPQPVTDGAPIGFLLSVGDYEGGVDTWGNITFTQSPQGRWQIQAITFAGEKWVY